MKEGQGQKIIQELETNLIVKYWSKNFFKSLSSKLKFVFLSLLTLQQTAYVQNGYIGKAGRLSTVILDIFDKLGIDGYLVTVDIPWSWIFTGCF